jgi:hypothetical protein
VCRAIYHGVPVEGVIQKSHFLIFLDVVYFVLKFLKQLICVFFTSYATTHCSALVFSLKDPTSQKMAIISAYKMMLSCLASGCPVLIFSNLLVEAHPLLHAHNTRKRASRRKLSVTHHFSGAATDGQGSSGAPAQ